jgi:hypothetical protein
MPKSGIWRVGIDYDIKYRMGRDAGLTDDDVADGEE